MADVAGGVLSEGCKDEGVKAYTLVSFPSCPFVQRAIIALREKGVDYDVSYVELDHRPEWFVALSPLGKVPLLKVHRAGQPDAVLFESAVILEYLEETAGGAPLHPADPLERAQHRGWIEFGSNLIMDLWRYFTVADPKSFAEAYAPLMAKLRRVEAQLGDGPFFGGTQFCAVDATFAPIFRQIDAVETVVPTGLLADLPKLAAWSRALAARPSVQGATLPDFTENYLERLRGMGSQVLKQAA